MKYLVRITDLNNHADFAIFEATPKEMNIVNQSLIARGASSTRQATSRFYLQLQQWDDLVLIKEVPAFITDADVVELLFPMFGHRPDLAPQVRKRIEILT